MPKCVSRYHSLHQVEVPTNSGLKILSQLTLRALLIPTNHAAQHLRVPPQLTHAKAGKRVLEPRLFADYQMATEHGGFGVGGN